MRDRLALVEDTIERLAGRALGLGRWPTFYFASGERLWR